MNELIIYGEQNYPHSRHKQDYKNYIAAYNDLLNMSYFRVSPYTGCPPRISLCFTRLHVGKIDCFLKY